MQSAHLILYNLLISFRDPKLGSLYVMEGKKELETAAGTCSANRWLLGIQQVLHLLSFHFHTVLALEENGVVSLSQAGCAGTLNQQDSFPGQALLLAAGQVENRPLPQPQGLLIGGQACQSAFVRWIVACPV